MRDRFTFDVAVTTMGWASPTLRWRCGVDTIMLLLSGEWRIDGGECTYDWRSTCGSGVR